MTRVGIWEKQERVSGAVRRSLGRRMEEIQLVSGRHPAEFAGEAVDLLCIGPDSDGWAGARSAECGVLLLPGAAGPLARGMRCRSAVSYGTSPRDTLTFSSLEGTGSAWPSSGSWSAWPGTWWSGRNLWRPFRPGRTP